jgi:nitrogen fixation protein NifU and related proteins
MADALEQLYQQVILDHAKERHGRGLREAGPQGRQGESRQYNPLCGDEVTLRVDLVDTPEADPDRAVVRDLSWTGEGCSISQAATSVLHDLVVGREVRDVLEVVGTFRTMIRSRGTVEPDEAVLGDAAAFAGVGRHANRVKCAMLGWTAFEAALLQAIPPASARSGLDDPHPKEYR